MDPLSLLPEEMDALVKSFESTPAVGDLIFGITQYSFWMFVAVALLLIVVFAFKRRQKIAPKGRFVNAFEFLVEYCRDDLCISLLGDTWREHFPFIASVFFFVLINNILGVIPGMHPGTGSIGATAALALVSFVYFVVIGMRKKGVIGYLKSLAPAGVAFPMNALVWVIELFSTFLRPITLAVRLFCNLFAGHVVMGTFAILASLYFTPILQSFSAQALAQVGVSVFWVAILLVIYAVELLVAAIQAYVFSLLSAVYIQLAEADEH